MSGMGIDWVAEKQREREAVSKKIQDWFDSMFVHERAGDTLIVVPDLKSAHHSPKDWTYAICVFENGMRTAARFRLGERFYVEQERLDHP